MPFITVENGRFQEGDRPYAFVGFNFWQGMNLASPGPGGDRERLGRELDRLVAMGTSNLRILAGSEGPADAPWRIAPPLQRAPGEYDEDLLDGLDYLLAEMGRRQMRAVLCLTNFWSWSGGMAQYLAWNGAGPIPEPLAPGGTFHAYQEYTSQFYVTEAAIADYERHLRFIVERVNAYSGLAYRDDPTIMAWELANEPRGMERAEAFRAWIDHTAGMIKSLDENHLVTTGSEGDTPLATYNGMDFVADHRSPHIDYATIHVWVENWLWFDPRNAAQTYSRAEVLALDYVRSHAERTRTLGKPLVLEEFGMARDQRSFDPIAAASFRDRYFSALLEVVVQEATTGGRLQGANIWAWAGEGRPRRPYGGPWTVGQDWLGDPAHEPQGWYSLYDDDESTTSLIRRFVARLDER